MDYFYVNGRLYVLICDYFSKFPFLFQVKTTSFANLKDHLQELFAVEVTPDEIMSNNGPPFNGNEFSSFLTGLGIRHTTSSPNYPQSNGFIERQIQMVKRLMEKVISTGRSFQEALTGSRAQRLGDGLPSPAEKLPGRSLVTRKATPVDVVAVHQSLIALLAKYTKSHLMPRSYDIPIISRYFASRTSTPSQSEITENQLSWTATPKIFLQ